MEDQIKHIVALKTLLDYDVRKIFIADMQLHIVLPEWIKSATSEKLKNVLSRYLDYIQHDIRSLELYLEKEKINPMDLTNIVMMAHIEDTYERITYCYDNEIKDACLLAATQEIIHYKISMYGTAAAYARALDMDEEATRFRESEINEKKIDDNLCLLAECEINVKAKKPVSMLNETEKLMAKNS